MSIKGAARVYRQVLLAEVLLGALLSLYPYPEASRGYHGKGVGGSGNCLSGQHHLHQQEHVLSSSGGIRGGESKRAHISGPQAAGEVCQHTGIDIKTDIEQRRDLFPDRNLKEGSLTLISSKKMTFFFFLVGPLVFCS